MSTEKVRKVLVSLGLAEKEAELYIFIARHCALRTGELARGTRIHRVEVYRLLKNMQKKGVIEATLESPRRFTAVPLETVLDSFIRVKQEETVAMENTKQSVLNEWKKIHRIEAQPNLEKFVVVEGNKKICSKLLQMIKETKSQLSIAIPISTLVRADQFGVLDALFNHSIKNKIELRFLTELSNEDMKMVKALFERTDKKGIKFKGRNLHLGLKLSARMALRDKEELLFFIKANTEMPAAGQDDMCLWTNCKTLAQSFAAVFEDMWVTSVDINERISELEAGITASMDSLHDDTHTTPKTYDEVIGSAKSEIIITTSSEGLVEYQEDAARLRDLSEKGVSVKVMAPITKKNWQAAKELSQCCLVRHTPAVYLESMLVDGKYLIQSKDQPPHDGKRERIPYFGTLYTSSQEYVKRAKNTLDELWRSALVPSFSTLDSAINTMSANASFLGNERRRPAVDTAHRKLLLNPKSKRKVLLEKDVLDKIINGTKYPFEKWPNDVVRSYGSMGLAVIHPPVSFNLPDMTIWALHTNKQSSFGAADALLVFLWLETPKGNAYVPAALIGDNHRQVEFHRKIAANTPSEQNSHLVKKDELQIRVHGSTLFAGWTIPIPLFPPSRVLPPACIMFEGFGPLTTSVVEFGFPSGVRVTSEFNGFDAFVTFYHPASKYSGPGTDGRINRDVVTTFEPPK